MAAERPGRLTFGSAGVASFGHIAGEIVKSEAKVDMLHAETYGLMTFSE